MAPQSPRRGSPAACRRAAPSVRLQCGELEGRIAPALFNVQTPMSFTGLNNNGCVAATDLNKDGFTDAILTNFGTDYASGAGSTITVLYGRAGGGFNRAQLSTGGTNVAFVSVADINADTWPDVVVANANKQNTGSVSVFRNDGAGNLSLVGTPFSTFGNNTAWVGLADVTGDGVLDAITCSFGKEAGEDIQGNNATVFQGNADGQGNGNFTFSDGPTTTLPTGIEFIPTALAVADFDGDGNTDIAAAVPAPPPDFGQPYPNGSVYMFRGTGGGGFDSPNQFDTGGVFPVNVQAADLNGDGKKDLVVANAGDANGNPAFKDNSVGYLLNVSSGSSLNFGITNTLTTNCKGTFAVAVADLNLDGKADIAAVNYGGVTGTPPAFVSIYTGNGTGGFAPGSPGTYDTQTSISGGQYLAVGDYDGNGSPDLIVSHASNKVGLLLNTSVAGPTVTINQGAAQADPTNGTAIVYDVVFSGGVSGFTGSDIDFTGSSVGGLSAAVAELTPSTYTVSITGMAGTGTVKAAIPAGAATSTSGSGTNLASTSTDNVVAFDFVGPTVTVNQAAGQVDPAAAGPILFTVVFNENVSGFGPADVDLTASSLTGLSASVTQNTPKNYTVSVTGMSGNGTVVAKVLAGAATDAAGNANVASTSTDNTVTFGSATGPTVTINQGAAQADPTNGTAIVYDVVFSGGVSGFTGSDIDFTGSSVGGLSAAVTELTPSTYTVSITGMAGTGTVRAAIPAGAATSIANSTASLASTSTDNQVAFDLVAPTVTVNQAAGQVDPAAAGPILFTVVFAESVSGFGDADVDLSGSSLTGLSASVTQNTPSNYTIAVSGMTAGGTVVARVPAGSATDTAGNLNAASTSTDNTVTFTPAAGPAGTLSLSAATYQVDEAAGTFTVFVNRTGGTDGSVTADFSVTNGSAGAGDYAVTTTPAVLTWADGDADPKPIAFTIADDALSEGKETIRIGLANPSGGAVLGTALGVLTILQSDGRPAGTFTSTDDGDLTTVKMSPKVGGGSLLVYLTNDATPISLIELAGTNPAKSVLNVTVKKVGDGLAAVGGVIGTGVKTINLWKSQMSGEGIRLTGPVQSVRLAGISGEADIVAAGFLPKKTTRISVKNAIGNGTDITLNQKLSSLTATAYGLGGKITVPSIGTVSIKGNFRSDVEVTGAGVGNTSVGSFKVVGQVDGSTINVVNGNVKNVSVGTFVNSRLFVGYTGDDVGGGTFDPSSVLTSFKTTFKTPAAFHNSSVIGSVLKTVALSGVDDQNGGDGFGVFANSFRTVSVKLPIAVTYRDSVGGTSSDFSVQAVV